MPDWVRDALDERGLMEAYKSRPAYQQNDWIAWIEGAKQKATREGRLAEMLDDLEKGDTYMGMGWRPRRRPA
jgi:hypothetical protein